MTINIINSSNNELPAYQRVGDAGMDLRAVLPMELPVHLEPMERMLIRTGLHLELPENIEAQIRPRSGLALKHGITVLNAPGTIDSNYRGEIGVILINLSNETFKIEHGDRIAQMVFNEVKIVQLGESSRIWLQEQQSEQRGNQGFGSSGVK